jgi:hypothetical protein
MQAWSAALSPGLVATFGDAWELTGTASLAGARREGTLDMGWTPWALAPATGANTTGVQNPCAVLAAQISPAELAVPAARSAHPPWCGECDQLRRMLDYHATRRAMLEVQSTAAAATQCGRAPRVP